jgi:cysteine desulfurase family protein (TIGR01976 family)
MIVDELLGRSFADLLAAPMAEQFPGLRPGVSRFDAPGGTLTHEAVRDAVSRYLGSELVANDHGAFAASRYCDEIAEWTAGRLRRLFGAAAGHVVLGPNMTTLTSMFTRAAEAGLRPGDEIVCTELDHEANVWPWMAMARRRGVQIRTARIDPDGELPAASVVALITDRTRWVAITAASNALGTITDLATVVTAAHAVGARVFVDGVQLVAHRAVQLDAWGVDAFVTSAYKWYGPHGGALWISAAAAERLTLPEQVPSAGDDLPGRLDLGTTAFETVLGMGVAAEVVAGVDRDAVQRREDRLAGRLRAGLAADSRIRVLGPVTTADRVPIVTFQVTDLPAEKVAAHLADRGVAVWHGTFYCTPAMRTVSPAEPDAVRAGVARYSTDEDVDELLAAVAETIRAER